MEGLKPITEGIENLPQAFTFPAMQPLGEASGQKKLFEKLLEPFEEEALEEEEATEASPENLGKIAYNYLHRKDPYLRDTTFGIYVGEDGLYYIGSKQATIADNNIIVDDEKFVGTPGLWELIMKKNPSRFKYTREDSDNYGRLMVKTNALHRDFDPNNPHPRSSESPKWMGILGPIWLKKKYEGKGVVVIPSDPNALLERLDLLLASQEAGHTGVGNELVSICDELKRQGVLDTKAYKKLNSIIKK